MIPDLQTKILEFYLYTYGRNNVLKFKGHFDKTLSLLDIRYYANKLFSWFNISLIYFYWRRDRACLYPKEWLDQEKIRLISTPAGYHDLYIIERKIK